MKTVKEAAKEYGRKVSPQSDWTARNAEISFKSGVEYAQHWIAIEEELPEISDDKEDWFFEDDKYVRYSKDVLMKSNTGKVAVGCLCEDGCWVSDDIINTLNITHWRPIDRK